MKESRVYIFLCVCALFPHPRRVVWGILCRFLLRGEVSSPGLHSHVISTDNGLVKAGILQAPSPFDCVGQLWRNGHYLPVSGSIKKPPCPSYPSVWVPTGGGTWAGHTLLRRKWRPGSSANIHSHNCFFLEPVGDRAAVFTHQKMVFSHLDWKSAINLSAALPHRREISSNPPSEDKMSWLERCVFVFPLFVCVLPL